MTKYHAEGDEDSVLVKAEMAQIRSTIIIELDNSKQSWLNMVETPGMRRRTYIAIFLGLCTQMSGNSLLSYYTNLLFPLMGYTTSYDKSRINVANQVWGLVTATIFASFVVARFKRRVMFLLAIVGMLLVFISMTISFSALADAKAHKVANKAAGISALFWYYAFNVPYNLGDNALVYSMFSNSFLNSS